MTSVPVPLVSGFGWRPDLPDLRDHLFSMAPGEQRLLPAKARVVDKREPVVWDQGNLGSCTAHMGCYLAEHLRRKAGVGAVNPSRLFLYWFTRFVEGGVEQTRWDSGATIRDTVRALAVHGVATEQAWPYRIERFTRKPSATAERTAADRQVLSYQRVVGLDQMRASLADGYPVGFGFLVFESMLSAAVAKSGVVPMPSAADVPLGGHACAFVGYDDSKRLLEFRNSWGPSWGKRGYGFMPYEYAADPRLLGDCWTVRAIELPAAA